MKIDRRAQPRPPPPRRPAAPPQSDPTARHRQCPLLPQPPLRTLLHRRESHRRHSAPPQAGPIRRGPRALPQVPPGPKAIGRSNRTLSAAIDGSKKQSSFRRSHRCLEAVSFVHRSHPRAARSVCGRRFEEDRQALRSSSPGGARVRPRGCLERSSSRTPLRSYSSQFRLCLKSSSGGLRALGPFRR